MSEVKDWSWFLISRFSGLTKILNIPKLSQTLRNYRPFFFGHAGQNMLRFLMNLELLPVPTKAGTRSGLKSEMWNLKHSWSKMQNSSKSQEMFLVSHTLQVCLVSMIWGPWILKTDGDTLTLGSQQAYVLYFLRRFPEMTSDVPALLSITMLRVYFHILIFGWQEFVEVLEKCNYWPLVGASTVESFCFRFSTSMRHSLAKNPCS